MGKISFHSPNSEMNSKLSLMLFGALITLAVLSAAENMEENSLSEEIASSRLARAADADPGKRKRNKKSKRKNKASKKKASRKSKKKSKINKSKRKSKKAMKKKNKKAQKKKNKKAQKNKNKKAKRKNKSNDAKQSSTVPDTCLSTAVNTLYNGLSKKASNFDRQLKRIEARLPKIESKRGKAGDYNQTMDDLIAANATGCPAGNQTEIVALIATLGECQTNIETDCATPMINQTQIDECKPIVEGFVAEVEKCFGLNSDPAAACVCWESEAMAELEMGLKGCVIKESEANVTAGFKACKGAVSTCNKAQTGSIPVLVACSKTEADLVAEAAQIANNIGALNQAKAAVEAAASRSIRALATNCTEYIALVDMLLELSVESPEITDVAEDIVASSVTCTDEEKATLATSVTALDEVIAEAEAALDILQEQIEDATGSTAAIETTPFGTVTTAAARMRMRGFMKQLKFKM